MQHYLTALDHTTRALRDRMPSWRAAAAQDARGALLQNIDHAVFHAPYNKMVQKAWRRLQLLDSTESTQPPTPSGASPASDSPPAMTSPLAADAAAPLDTVVAALPQKSSVLDDPSWHAAVAAGAHGQRLVGNCYCASVFVGLASLVEAHGRALCGQQVLLFSFGSGVASSVMMLQGRQPAQGPFSLEVMASRIRLRARLEARRSYPPAVMAHCMELLHRRYCGQWEGTVQCLEGDFVRVPPPPVNAWRLASLQPDGRALYSDGLFDI